MCAEATELVEVLGKAEPGDAGVWAVSLGWSSVPGDISRDAKWT